MSKADDIFWREFGIVLMALVLFTVIVFFVARTIGWHTFEMMRNSPHAVLERIQPIGQVRVGESGQVVAPAAPASTSTQMTAAAGEAGAESGEQVYNSVCTACHTSGVAGAPKLGDKAAWQPRLAQGMDTLLHSATNGKGAMPPKGGNPKLTEAELKSAIGYMLQKAGLAEGGAGASSQSAQSAESEKPAESQATTEASAGGDASAAAGEAVYSKTCVACHSTGVAGAPKVGDSAAWEARAAQGMSTLVATALKGKGAMPPKGGNMSLTDTQIQSAILYMLKQSGVKPG